ncbi:D-amino acid aminotransferase [Ectothiorhodospira lacustris]|uniref:D-amino acid aminotransferase n=1 Tax=Ectothiorhodospira lacustris TaxID=2899127 RepID=UPI001EE8A702|nr:D-amino acid aminotransferase [Ectothiorhodospira lacustris]MCG5508848.1 D-amino acid aminotransferase [Ectothiorhodospira lacustris]MCG5520639.1 D-amino acid aminotransferase [Ectothiorhodospira lacustris]
MIIYLNGEFVPEAQARVSVFDRGFLFGDGIYEVIPVFGGHPLRLTEHLERLERSLAEVRIDNPHDRTGWKGLFMTLLEKNPGGDRSLYVQVTRGVARRDHAFPSGVRPTVFAMVNPIAPPNPAVLEQGVAAVVIADHRWSRCDIKAITLLPNVLARQEALDSGATEAILIRQGLATEGAASNLFAVGDGVIVTPPKDRSLLPGITRDLVLELAQDAGLPVMESAIPEQSLRAAEEIWLTSSTREILPVTRLDGRPVGAGVPGPVWRRLHGLYQDYKARLREGV